MKAHPSEWANPVSKDEEDRAYAVFLPDWCSENDDLTILQGGLQILREQYEFDKEGQLLLENMRDAARRCGEKVSEMQGFAARAGHALKSGRTQP